MSGNRLRLAWYTPGSASLEEAVRSHIEPNGVVTSFESSAILPLYPLREEIEGLEFMGFESVVAQASRIVKMDSTTLPTPDQVHAILETRCGKLAEGNPFYASRKFVGTHRALSRAIQELRHFGYHPEDLRTAAGAAESHSSRKLTALADIWQGLEDDLHDLGFEFGTERAVRMLELSGNTSHAMPNVVAVAGTSFEPQYLSWLQWLCAQGTRVSILIEGIPARADLFQNAWRTIAHLGIDAEAPEIRPALYQTLFDKVEPELPAPQVSVLTAADPLTEAEWIVRTCIKEVGQGVIPERIVIALRDPDTYHPLLQMAARLFGAPLWVNHSVELLTNSFVAFILCLLECLADSDVRKLRRVLPSTYLQIDPKVQKELSDLLIEARHHEPAWEWLETQLLVDAPEYRWLLDILDWRKSVLAESASWVTWVDRFRKLTELDPLPTTVMSEANPTQRRDEQARNRMQISIARYGVVFDHANGRNFELPEFVRKCREIWENQECTVPPGQRGGIRLVNHLSRVGDADVLLVPGMLEGQMPRRRSEDPILDDADREQLSRACSEKPPLLSSHEKARMERDDFVRMVALAGKKLVLSLPITSDDRDNTPAFYLYEIQRALTGKIDYVDLNLKMVFPPIESAVTPRDLVIREKLDGPRETLYPTKLTQPSAKAAVTPPYESGVYAEELGRALLCTFQSSCRDRLNLWPSTTSHATARITQIPKRAHLSTAPDRETARAAIDKEVQEELASQFAQLEFWEWRVLESAAKRYADQWIDREFKMREIWPVQPGKSRARVRLGQNGTRQTIELGDRKITLLNEISALVLIGNMGVVVDYRHSDPSLKYPSESGGDSAQNHSRRLVHGLLLQQATQQCHAQALLIDSLNKPRHLYLANAEEANLPSVKGVAEVTRFTNTFEDLHHEVVFGVRSAVAKLDRLDMAPTPGDYCELCEYGELCRSGSQFSDSMGSFEEDTE
ncbi:MAG: hypothetical protein JST40_06200 [Armatimonadetes bacterium]|nr:hypothetical protein [Armatimonadota bacterium]